MHDRAFQRASRELRDRRKERAQAERGFESKKRAEAAEQRAQAREQRAEAAEQRREKQENRKAEKHKLEMAILKERQDREMAKSMAEATKIASQLEHVLPGLRTAAA